jgi:hypothetical protein
MNRSNFWVRITIVAIIVTFAAVLGQIQRWRTGSHPAIQETSNLDKKPRPPKRPRIESEPEVLG